MRKPAVVRALPTQNSMQSQPRSLAAGGDAGASLSLATRIMQALTTRSFRQHAGDWSPKDDGNGEAHDLASGVSWTPPVIAARERSRQAPMGPCTTLLTCTFSPAPWLAPLLFAASMNATISTVTAGSSGAFFVTTISTIFFTSSR